MKRDEFLKIISDGLQGFPEGELNDIMYDYREHFDVGTASGKTEEEIITELGDPYEIVNQYRSGYIESTSKKSSSQNSSNANNNSNNNYNNAQKKTSNTANTILIVVAITLSLMLFGPFVGAIVTAIGSVLIALMFASGGIAVAGIGILIGKVVTNTIGLFTFPAFILEFPNKVIVLIVIGSILFFIFSILAIYYFIKTFIILMKRFLKWVGPKLRGEA